MCHAEIFTASNEYKMKKKNEILGVLDIRNSRICHREAKIHTKKTKIRIVNNERKKNKSTFVAPYTNLSNNFTLHSTHNRPVAAQ